MRKALDTLYDAAAWLAAACMTGTLVMVVLGMVDRYITLGLPGTDMYAGYFMAGAGFLALAHTLKRGEHIRVTLLLASVGPRARRVLERFSLLVAVLLSGALAWYSIVLAYQSWSFHDVSTGNDATPLWIPQIGMALGTVVLCVAFVDELQLEWRGLRVVVQSDEALHNE
ncbi:MAG: TRAP transporter small permease [Betaproteobacteria bacterium]|nr:TRAP transporter small permease [Betaproteobacteria bacterium]MDE2047495.1 TRAP transporter small permease [Betaproteobacteria bacterium]